MAKLIPAAERITRARALIEKAREVPVPPDSGRFDLSYVAQIKGIMREAKDLVKFITYQVGASADVKSEAAKIMKEAEQAEKDILHG